MSPFKCVPIQTLSPKCVNTAVSLCNGSRYIQISNIYNYKCIAKKNVSLMSRTEDMPSCNVPTATISLSHHVYTQQMSSTKRVIHKSVLLTYSTQMHWLVKPVPTGKENVCSQINIIIIARVKMPQDETWRDAIRWRHGEIQHLMRAWQESTRWGHIEIQQDEGISRFNKRAWRASTRGHGELQQDKGMARFNIGHSEIT